MLSRLRREIEKDKFCLQARQGYPVTRTPYTPPILDSVVDTKTLKGEDAMLKLFFAKDGSDLVKTKSLEFIRQFLMKYFVNFPAIIKGLEESPLPCNTIAVTSTTHNFYVGDVCTEVIPLLGQWESGYFTYQRLSENCQVTYFNLDGQEYFASICYYPVLHGMPKMLKLDRKLMYLTNKGGEYYPLEDRNCSSDYKHSLYGRYCQTAGKRVVVNFANVVKGVCHQEIDYTKKDAYKLTECKECAEEKKTYKYVRPGRDATSTPSAPEVKEVAAENPAPKEQLLSDDAEILSFFKSLKIGLPELKTLVSNAQKNAVEAQETTRENLDQPKASEAVVSGPKEICAFTPEKIFPETEPVQTLNLLDQALKPDDGSRCHDVQDEDTQSSTSAGSIPTSSPALNPHLSEFSYFLNDPRYTSESYLDKKLKEIDVMMNELKMLQKELHKPMTSDEEAQVISSASFTESLMEDFERVEEGITDIDSDIDAEIVN